ncbi:response regulator transcription factor [Arcobacter vandammei]|uniref:response regulator transcription factor n=1 Tax=Arcobacter vandammei TaxID=2782243 RepID=UPI0018DF7FCA|nr:response regulator transcription factor [Arcobacter vandammei]
MSKENLKNFTLLYAEDDKAIQKEMLEYFSSYFKEVFVCDDGKEALKLYDEKKPDVLVLDIYMPFLSGMELTKIIRKNDHKTKIVLITAFSKDSLLLDAINTDVNYYITKPASLQKIKDMLDKISLDLERNSTKIVKIDENLHFNMINKKLYIGEFELKLSKKEADLLELFVKNVQKSISIEDIMACCWSDFNSEISIDSVKSLVSSLRKKLPKDSLVSVYGIGYSLRVK